jgi:hypothetical protein
MISFLKIRRLAWCLAPLMTASTVPQSLSQSGAAAKQSSAASAPPWRQKTIRFSDEKIILGLPAESSRSMTYCSDAGTIFVDLYGPSSLSGSQSMPELYSILPSGEVKGLHRMIPSDLSDISIRDFFAADQTLVTLLEGVKRDDQGNKSGPR